jgi:hypothetical protein
VELIVGVAVLAVAIGFVAWPLVRDIAHPAPSAAVDPAAAVEHQRALVYQSLLEIDLDYRSGKLSEDDYRAQMERGLASAAALLAEVDGANGAGTESRPTGGSQ